MTPIEKQIRDRLFEMGDEKFRDFCVKLTPGMDRTTVIGVRTPELRALAKELSRNPDIKDFLAVLPHEYYEENNLHGFLLESIKDYDECVFEVNRFLPYVDNWATCDLISPRVFKKHTDRLLLEIRRWISSEHVFTARFGAEMLMRYYLDERFDPEYPELVSGLRSDEYYIKMMVAWYFATALAKQYDAVIPYIENRRLEKWTHNKTIQKAVESYRVTDEHKAYLKTLRIR